MIEGMMRAWQCVLLLLICVCLPVCAENIRFYRIVFSNCSITCSAHVCRNDQPEIIGLNKKPDEKPLPRGVIEQLYKELPGLTSDLRHDQPWSHRMLGWGCVDECNYKCMWLTEQRAFQNGDPASKYFGKWPFVAVLGVQELASTLFSVCHSAVTIFMARRIWKTVPHSAPMFWIISGYCIVIVHTWIWSAAYHARDIGWIEKMDYYGANATVFYSIFILCARILLNKPKWLTYVAFTGILVFFCRHVTYLHTRKFDYGYNMKIMIGTGILNSTGWLVFHMLHIRRKPFHKKGIASMLITLFFVLFEWFDHSPFWGLLDAHAIWHGGTIVSPYLFFSFIAEEMTDQWKQKKINDNSNFTTDSSVKIDLDYKHDSNNNTDYMNNVWRNGVGNVKVRRDAARHSCEIYII